VEALKRRLEEVAAGLEREKAQGVADRAELVATRERLSRSEESLRPRRGKGRS